MQYTTKDSGKREQFDTGMVRDTREGKGRYDLIPPQVLRRDALLYERGAAKYDDWNWSKGAPFTRFIDSAFRHLMQFAAGDDSEDHLAAVRFNVGAIIYFQEVGRAPELDDRRSEIPNLTATAEFPQLGWGCRP